MCRSHLEIILIFGYNVLCIFMHRLEDGYERIYVGERGLL